MKFHLLYLSSVSACFELENQSPYYAEAPFDVTVNGQPALSGVRTNVFSLFDLTPNTEYQVAVGENTLTVTTKLETACLNVMDFGAKADGVADDTLAIQNAIFACPEQGRVLIPAGTYRFRPLVLKSHITLDLHEGAHLIASTDIKDYPAWPGEIADASTGEAIQVSSWEGLPHLCHQSILSAHYAKNIAIVGKGTLDGNAQNAADWWERPKDREISRPKLVFLNQCENVVFHGILGKNSPAWNFHPFFSKNISFYDMAVEAPKHSPNTDGSDPESCDGVNYIGMRFSVGDDAIAIKAGKMYMGMKYKTPASNHVIRNCLMEYAHGAVVLGSEMSGGIQDLTVSQCLFVHTDRGLRIKTCRGRGKYAVVDGVEFSNIKMDNVQAPLVVNMYYSGTQSEPYLYDPKPYPLDDTTPYLGSFVFRDMECTDCEWAAGYFYGLPEQPVKSVSIENVRFTFKEDAQPGQPAMIGYAPDECKLGLYFNQVKEVSLKNVTMEGQVGEKVITLNTENVTEQ